jgi:hypothetical protein
MKRKTISVMALALAGVLPFGCWSTPTGAASAPPRTGTVVGTFGIIGGPAPGVSIPARGTVIFTPLKQNQGGSVRAAVHATGRFIAHIPRGTWKVTASSPQFNHNQRGACGAVHPITIKVGMSTAVRCVAKQVSRQWVAFCVSIFGASPSLQNSRSSRGHFGQVTIPRLKTPVGLWTSAHGTATTRLSPASAGL